MRKEVERLHDLYLNLSKHSNYQILPTEVGRLMELKENDVNSRYEKERLDFILRHIDPKDKIVIDIGGNTGYFTFELLESGAQKVIYYDGNSAHAEFVSSVAELLSKQDQVEIHPCYFDFTGSDTVNYDTALLLNVVHHLGDDYGEKKLTMKEAKLLMISQINKLSENVNTLVLQMGYCWKGDRNCMLFDNGSKEELISFIREGTQEHWEITNIGIPEGTKESIFYHDMNERNLRRMDNLGEFLNRPIFIMKSYRNGL